MKTSLKITVLYHRVASRRVGGYVIEYTMGTFEISLFIYYIDNDI